MSTAPTPPISPFPAAAVELPPPLAAVEVTPEPDQYPHTVVTGQPFRIGAQTFPVRNTPSMSGVLRWRRRFAPAWHEQPLDRSDENRFSVEWSPPTPGDYEWCVELWVGDDAQGRPGSSGADAVQQLRVLAADPQSLRWHHAPTVPLRQMIEELNGAPDLLLLPPIFPHDDDGKIGRAGGGHYSIDAELGNTGDFGALSAAARSAGVALGLTLPLRCSAEHPLRVSQPGSFTADGLPQFADGAWRQLWAAWEAVFRFWLVQGIDLFHIPDSGIAPVSFWQGLIDDLRDDFPNVLFTTTNEELSPFGRHLLGAGFCRCPLDRTALRESAAEAQIDARSSDAHPGEPSIDFAPPSAEACETEVADVEIPCRCSNDAMRAKVIRRADVWILEVSNSQPDSALSGHIHFDGDALGLDEHDRYYVRDRANGRAYAWAGTTNFLSLAAGEARHQFLIERH